MKKFDNFLWVEKFRPQTISHTVLPARFKKFFNKLIKAGETTNLLLYSVTAGTGKSTVAIALANDLNAEYIFINVSNERGIDVVRTQISRFASTKSVNGKAKLVILDEFDGSTPELQAALRSDIEKYRNTCRFIMTCNYKSKLLDPLQEGRTMEFNFDITDRKTTEEMKPKMVKRILGILKQEKIVCNESTIIKLVDKCYPNMRKMISLLQKYALMYDQIDDNIFNIVAVDDEFFQLVLNKKLPAARKFMIENSYNYDEMYRAMFDGFIPLLDSKLQSPAILIIGDYMDRNSRAIDKEINFTCCLIELMDVNG